MVRQGGSNRLMKAVFALRTLVSVRSGGFIVVDMASATSINGPPQGTLGKLTLPTLVPIPTLGKSISHKSLHN